MSKIVKKWMKLLTKWSKFRKKNGENFEKLAKI